MPIVHIHMLEGKTVEQKRRMAKLVTEALVKSLGVKAEDVIIQVVDLPRHDVSVGGRLVFDMK
ncbi:MAG: tautomerase family protein [Candidatus Bathyarchaeota archaeon]|nr:tautomerase family protein [Candidatus Bathyarchaeota archaeon]MDH5689261.1 tautomerase family protein [Candidatus Bathyarchaeota archaeon]